MKEEIYIVRAICKISSALTNLDELYCDVGEGNCNEFFKGKFYRDFNKFFDYFEHHTEEMVKAMYSSNSGAFSDILFYHLQSIDEDLDADSEELLHIGLMVAKLKSALRDLKKVDLKSPSSRLVAEPLIGRLSTLLPKPYVKKLPVCWDGFDKLVCRISSDLEFAINE
jgi:hypothetical protein